MLDDQEKDVRETQLPVQGDPTSSKAEQIHELVQYISANYHQASRNPAGAEKKTIGSRELKIYRDWLEKAHAYFQEASSRELTLTLASEWVLDNYYIIRQVLLQISEDLPAGYYRQLPKLEGGALQGLPRIYAISQAILSFQNYLLNVMDLQTILVQVQDTVPLTMGELWALPIFLRFTLIEALARQLELIIRPERFPVLPVFAPLLEGKSLPTKGQEQESAGETLASGVVANTILSLRTISEQDWSDFFEAVSSHEHTLRQDPAGIYPWMDFKTRDMYRKEIEKLSLASGHEENRIARITLQLARENGDEKTRPSIQTLSATGALEGPLVNSASHIGVYLLGRSRQLLEHRLGYHPNLKTRLLRWAMRHGITLYLAAILAISLGMMASITLLSAVWQTIPAASPFQLVSIILLALALLVATLTISTSLVNWLVTLWVKPRTLPKLNFVDGVPVSYRTMVVIPALIGNQRDVDNLTRQLEMNYLRNPEPGLLFTLLTDFNDADDESLPEDAELVRYATQAVRDMNLKYSRPVPACDPPDSPPTSPLVEVDRTLSEVQPAQAVGSGHQLFHLLHRKRLWNPSEGKWMGWERKRGKLHELNRALRGCTDTSFITVSPEMDGWEQLQCVRFIITLDADTLLPRGAARRLAGALAHPLNQAQFDDRTGQLLSGYTILQPRMEIHPRSANYSWFTRIFAGDAGLDLYTLAVSDAYQDLFAEGSYVGKGIYDVDAFERSVDQHIPENSVLSHDLLEGIMGRAGLVTDVTMIEDYPLNYYVQVKRQQRWTRGDWQLLPWLLHPAKFKVRFKVLNHWKMLDNLLRSLLAPMLMLIFFLGTVSMPHLTPLWVAIIFVYLGIPVFTSLTRSALQVLGGESVFTAFRPLPWSLARWLLAMAFLPYDTYNVLDAILTTLYRLGISRRNLLQWTTAAQAAHLFGLQVYRTTTWLRMIASTLLALGLLAVVQLVHWLTANGGLSPSLPYVAPLLLLWTISPLVDQWISLPTKPRVHPLSEEQVRLFRQVARRTWGFFERFVGPEDHWLPPDHFQEDPVGIIAHRTSPTNIGLLFTSTLAAYDLGYLDQVGLATRLSITMDALTQLDRFRGHFLNWYDTLTLQPLNPRYISTIDSGNLAACLIVTAQACQRMPRDRIFRWALWQGYLDTLTSLSEVLGDMHKGEFTRQVEEINTRIGTMQREILAVRSDPLRWYAHFQTAQKHFLPDLSSRLVELVTHGRQAFDLEAIRRLQEVAAQIERHHQAIDRTLSELVPWIGFLENLPPLLNQPQYAACVNSLRSTLQYNPRMGQMHDLTTEVQSSIADLHHLLEGQPADGQDATSLDHTLDWVESLDQAVRQAAVSAQTILKMYATTAARAERFVAEMDFQFLYHSQRRVFHNGFNLDTGQLDNNYYDLLASEARIASIISLAKGEVPQSHWLQLSRPMTRVENTLVLLSWSATMFEYLMPPLFLRSYPGTLLSDSAIGAVRYQISYGKLKGVPWGISEAGFHLFDANQNYQYRAFGVPGLGFKRGLGDDLVIAPYASLMAVGYDPHAVSHNLLSLLKHGGFGLYGLYESIDFTSSRNPPGSPSTVVREYMSHHQGMILMALANYFHQDVMVYRMHSDPRIQSVELLLQEQVPQAVPLQTPTAEDVKGLVRLTAVQAKIDPWSVPIHTAIPMVTLLSNGDYSTLLTNMGGGYSTWRGTDLTRWQADGILDSWGTWVYIQDLDGQDEESGAPAYWSAGFQPVANQSGNIQVTFFPHMAIFHRTERNITSTMEVTVCPDDPVEIRRLHLNNSSDRPSNLRLTSYGEVILTQQATDRRHPAFNKLFIESEFVPELNLQVFTRRARASDEKPVFLGHMLVVEPQVESQKFQPVSHHETDRRCFIGRGRTLRQPLALDSGRCLTGSSGATLDPIFALEQEIPLKAHDNAGLAYLTFAAGSREDIITLARRYSSWSLIERSFHQSNITAQAWLGKQGFTTRSYQNTLQVLSALLYPFRPARAAPEVVATNRLCQSGLWRFGISGDYPILLVEVDNPRQVDLVREVLQVHEFLRTRHMTTDVVILNHQRTDYGAELNSLLYRLINRLNSEVWLAKRGGIFILYADQINPDERALLQTAAGFLFRGERGSLADHIPDFTPQVGYLPDLIPTRSLGEAALLESDDPLPASEPLQFFNGFGGFTPDGREYVIELPPGRHTPAPWVNIIGYPGFGFMVSETGSQSTWAVNSGENRLTPWSNDPVRDPTGEALYLRDEETGDVWSPTPLPAGDGQPYRVRHGAGYTIFEHNSHGLRQRLTLFASPEDPVKVVHLHLENTWDRNRRITATQYVEWVLGITHAASLPYLVPEYDASEFCLLVTNPFSADFGNRTAFIIANKPLHGLTIDRSEFIGRGGTLASPAALRRIGLGTRLSPGEDLCAVLQLHIDLHPGGVEEIYFVLGQGSHKDHALELARRYHNSAYVGAALERTHVFWDHLLGTLQVRTPSPATDLLLNHWMLYQALSCRLWGRSAFYQPSGAFGFRDQLQDASALLEIDPAIARGQILNAAQYQFTEGDVMHWWHPPSGRGVRTHISDDLLWLPYLVAMYVEMTGDASLLREKIPFLDAPPLRQDEDERYNEYPRTHEVYTLLEHCHRAIEKGATQGAHGLPLIGTGDWNDGFNRVGKDGQGESVWLAWFLCDVLDRFASLCEAQGETERARRYRQRAKDYAAAAELAAWDGAWYRRAFYDDGTPLGSANDMECQIDAIAQSWAVISRAAYPDRSRTAMQSVLERLVMPQERLSLLFTPPFDKSERDPGYIKGYLPGIRENGGQYTHAAIWNAWAFTLLGDGKQAGDLFDLMNPIYHAQTYEQAEEYRVEPYVISADIYSQPPYLHRGGWSWYTGSAAWMYRLGMNAILGFKKEGNTLRINPVIPPQWDGYEIDYHYRSSRYHIQVFNPSHVQHGVQSVSLDGAPLDDHAIPLLDDGLDHVVEVEMGE